MLVIWFRGVLGVLLLRVWLVVGWCVSRVCSVSCWCSSVGSVLFWVVRCFVVLLVLVLLLLCFVRGCSSVCVAPPGCLLVGCGGCVALSAFLLLVLFWLLLVGSCVWLLFFWW